MYRTRVSLVVLSTVAFVAPAPTQDLISLTARSRVEAPDAGSWRFAFKQLAWAPRRTAIVICDMWNQHWCKGATDRVAKMAPRMNQVVTAARKLGVLIVHAPSGTMKHYEGHAARQRAQKAPRAPNLPDGIGGWCRGIPAEKKGAWPIDQSDGGCDCDPRCPSGGPWRRQIDTIAVTNEDAISDSGVEIWNLFTARTIENVILMGVHTNMCVIGRPFGLRNMARFGKNVVLMRDLTDTMYNSRKAPQVNHFTGTDLIVGHIEKYVCPTVTSTPFTATAPFRFKNDARPRVVLIAAEREYGSDQTLPALAHHLELKGGVCASVLQGSTQRSGNERNFIPGMEALRSADAAVLFVRRRALPRTQMQHLRDYLGRGKPLIALRTSSHAFAVHGDTPDDLQQWKDFDRQVLGCHYHGYPHGETRVRIVPEAASHPILKGLQGPYQVRETMYRSQPLSDSCTALMMGTCVSGEGDDRRYKKKAGEEVPDEPIAWVNTYQGAKIFYSTLGSAGASFKEPWFRRMLINAIFWALEKPVPSSCRDGQE